MGFLGHSVITLQRAFQVLSATIRYLLSLRVIPCPSLDARKRHFGGCEQREQQPWVCLEYDIWETKELLNENLNEDKVQLKQNYI